MRGLAFQTGITVLLLATVGLLALFALFPTLPLSTCTEMGTANAVSGPTLYAVEGAELRYATAGAGECSTHAAVPGVPVALLLVGGLLVAGSSLRE